MAPLSPSAMTSAWGAVMMLPEEVSLTAVPLRAQGAEGIFFSGQLTTALNN